MKYETKNYRITVKGSTDEIRNLIKEITLQFGRIHLSQLEKELSNLENISELEQFTYGIHNRIYYNKDTFLYVPNVSSKEGQRFHYRIFKEYFDKAYKKMNEIKKE